MNWDFRFQIPILMPRFMTETVSLYDIREIKRRFSGYMRGMVLSI